MSEVAVAQALTDALFIRYAGKADNESDTDSGTSDPSGTDAATFTVDSAYGQDTVDVPPHAWVEAMTVARDDFGMTYFDWLSAVDQLDDPDRPGFDVVVHLWSVPRRERLLLRTRVPADGVTPPALQTATGVFAGASWHERETFEMFGIDFPGHPHLVPLLLPDGFEGQPLRKDFILAARAAKAWPGAKEPGESDADSHDAPARPGASGRAASPGRRKTRPPGVPDPEVWGPRPPGPPDTPTAPTAPTALPAPPAPPAPTLDPQ